MLNIKGLKIKFPGEYNDAFLHGDALYLIDDKYFYIVDFRKLIETSIPDDPEIRILCRYAFLNNDFFYKADNDFYDFFNLPTIRKYLMSNFDKLRNIQLNSTSLNKYIKDKCEHRHRGAYHIEVYKNIIFISSDKGVFSYTFLNGKLLRESNLLPYPAYQINANYDNNIYFCCAENHLNILHFDTLSGQRCLSDWKNNIIKNKAISLDFSYSDLLVRDIDKNYHYECDSLLMNGVDRKLLTSEEKIYAYKEKSGDLLKNAKYITCNLNRMVKVTDSKIELFKLDYETRKIPEKNLDDYFESYHFWSIPRKINEIHDGFQTVFGYILDTDIGTVVLDDNLNDTDHLETALISRGENVKLRHFYRSINYSHLLLNIKNSHIEIYADLSDYFFPMGSKVLRRHITRYQARNSRTA